MPYSSSDTLVSNAYNHFSKPSSSHSRLASSLSRNPFSAAAAHVSPSTPTPASQVPGSLSSANGAPPPTLSTSSSNTPLPPSEPVRSSNPSSASRYSSHTGNVPASPVPSPVSHSFPFPHPAPDVHDVPVRPPPPMVPGHSHGSYSAPCPPGRPSPSRASHSRSLPVPPAQQSPPSFPHALPQFPQFLPGYHFPPHLMHPSLNGVSLPPGGFLPFQPYYYPSQVPHIPFDSFSSHRPLTQPHISSSASIPHSNPHPRSHASPPVEPSTESKLPPLSTIPRFGSSADWGSWFNAVTALVDHLGLNGHICVLPPPGMPFDPTCEVVVPPPSPPHDNRDDMLAYKNFWRNDNICTYILTGKLSSEIFNSLPPARGGPYNFPVRTARDVLAFLRRRYSVGSAASAQQVKDSVINLVCSQNAIPAYVLAWRVAVNQLSSTPWDFTPYERIQRFMDGVPDLRQYSSLREDVRQSWENNPTGTYDFYVLADKILEIDIDYRRRQLAANNRTSKQPSSQRSNTHSNTSSSTPQNRSDALDTSNKPRSNDATKDNHFRPKANIASIDPITEPIPAPELFVVETCHTPVQSVDSAEENNTVFAAYIGPDASDKVPPYFAFVSSADDGVLNDTTLKFNSILDSGCTHHIIKDKRHFWTYCPELAVPVGTANCGTLNTLARGEVRFNTHVNGKTITLILKDCLHAPTVPINLLSVGSMVEHDMKFLFEREATS
ncbi:hypothetical protein C0992_002306, partial [Termitomyces sp. T32_za158]